MFEIETMRLRLLPLTLAQLQLVGKDFFDLEKELGLKHSSFELNAPPAFMKEFYQAIQQYTILAVATHPDHYTWYTHWLIINREENLLCGGIGATGLPDENGETMIGYFIDRKYEGRGLASEAVSALTAWMFLHPGMKRVIALTEEERNPSVRVLLKNSFIADGKAEGGYKWAKYR